MLGHAVTDLEDASVRTIVTARIVVVALVLVVPVDQEKAAVRPTFEADDLRPEIVGEEEIGGVGADRTPSPCLRADRD